MATTLHRIASESLHLGAGPIRAALASGADVLAGAKGMTALDLAQQRFELTHGKGGLGRELAPLIGGDRSQEALALLERATLQAIADRVSPGPTRARRRL